jgi:hypothetical protein
MVYGAEAVLPADIAFRSPRVENFDADRSEEARELKVNYSEERRLDSCVRTAKTYLYCANTIIGMSRSDSLWSGTWS